MSLNDFNNQDKDLESSLLQQFSCMSTSNKDDLIKEFQRLLSPNQLNAEGCIFFLDMNNWNLQAAICSYFDYDAHKLLNEPQLPSVSFLGDVTVGEGFEVAPDTSFVKTWKLANTGTTTWPVGCFLTFLTGYRMGPSERVLVNPLAPGESTDVSINMISPSTPGVYQGQWRMCTNTGQYFGDIIWVIITVAEGGLLGLTQQMNSFQMNLSGSTATNKPNDNTLNNPQNNHSNPFEPNLSNNLVQRIKDSEMQIDEDKN